MMGDQDMGKTNPTVNHGTPHIYDGTPTPENKQLSQARKSALNNLNFQRRSNVNNNNSDNQSAHLKARNGTYITDSKIKEHKAQKLRTVNSQSSLDTANKKHLRQLPKAHSDRCLNHTNVDNKAESNKFSNSLSRKDKVRLKESTSSSSVLSEKQGTFVKDEDSTSGLEVPRIDSASMSAKQVLRKDEEDRVKEANLSIVDNEDVISLVSSVTGTESQIPKVENESDKSPRGSQSDSGSKGDNQEGSDSNSVKGSASKTEVEPVVVISEDKSDTKDSDTINKDTSNGNLSVEKSFDRNTPFRLSSRQREGTPKSDVDTRQVAPKTPVPAEPILHKKSDYVSQHKKKQPENMSYNSTDIIQQAAAASGQQQSEEKPLSDDRIERLTDMLNQMSEKLGEADELNKKLKQKNTELEAELRQYKDTQQNTNTEINLIKTEWAELTKQLETTNEEREELKQQIANKGDEDKTRIQELTSQRAQLDDEVLQLKNDMQELLVARQRENKAHDDVMKAMEEEAVKKKDHIAKLESDYENQLRNLQAIIDRLTKENSELKDEKEALKTESGNLKTTIVNLQKEIEALKSQVAGLNSENQQLLAKLTAVQSERDSLLDYKKESEDLGDEVEGLMRERETLKDTLKEKEKIIEKQQGDVKSIEELAKSLDSLQQQNDKFAKQINNLTDENLHLRNQVNDKEKEVNLLQRNMAGLKEKAETSKVALSSMTDLIKEKQAHIEDLQKEVKTLSDTNSNYLVALESFSTAKKKDDDVVKAKYEDMETSHKKLLDENKRLRTVLAHKNMSETSQSAETEDLRIELDRKERELKLARERIAHLEAMMDDVYKAREIQEMHGDYVNEEEAKMSVTSLPDIRQDSRNTGYSQSHRLRSRTDDSSTWATYVDNRSNNLRKYRHADSYSKRFEHRPTKLRQSGVLTKLK